MSGFDPDHPTPRLDEVADLMDTLLLEHGAMTITEMACALDVPRGTVSSILLRPCRRHGDRFVVVGRTARGGAPGNTKLYDRASH